MNKKKLVVIGNGMVGHYFLEAMVENQDLAKYEIATFCEEPRPAYDRVHLSEYFSGATANDLSLVKPGFFENNGITIYIGDQAVSIDCEKKTIQSAKGRELGFDRLVIATGSYPFVPPINGFDRDGCYVYRTIDDLDRIIAGSKHRKVGVVVGGGLLGLEAAKALKDLGLETHVVEFSPRLMAMQIDEGGSDVLRGKIEALGVSVHTSKNTQKITAGESCQHKMIFVDGDALETDVIVFSAGIRPRDDLARDTGLEVGERGGIVINDYCQTSDPHIYAIGECALFNGQVFGLVAPGYQMARTVVSHLAQGEATFTGADMSTKLKLLGVDVASIGDAHGKLPGALRYTYSDEVAGIYKSIVVDENKKYLLGAILVGNSEEYGTLLQYAQNGIEIPRHPETLILPNHGSESNIGLGPDALPASAQICSCFDVSKQQICNSIDSGCLDLPSLKRETGASTGCGGCLALLKSLLDSELTKRGVQVNTDICEHFSYTRQDLYNIIRVEKLKNFEAVLTKHGQGRGCDICKPLVSSILASYWNEYILDSQHVGLQDTNDRALANMQKNGTYSVVPRIPGGEITPEKLIALGAVGKKYSLYTKITGGQRIDLFGAHYEQLPLIWSELIEAGFETGHAYGKAVRTVKSCVGSTWCRYGVEDSLGLAVEIENRYKGLRAPHKLKFAVSGCTRECAEAQSKDVGIIATENGWNLYVCGNGGMKPRHADLFATDLDKLTLIKYIDRFLMFYVRSADRLQRTSVWMDNLEGGLEYIRAVVVDDSLGISEELEAQMAQVIDGYECEWKVTLNSEDHLKKFRHFVNSDKTDSNVVFVEERGQIRPASENERATNTVSESI